MSDDIDISRTVPVYALAPIKFLGLDSGPMMIIVLIMMISKPFVSPIWIAIPAYVLARKVGAMSAGFPGGYLQYKISNLVCHPFMLKHFRGIAVVVGDAWKLSGSLPPPGLCSRYHP
jgi:TRAP-type mannitol/chloroaromatic compound transport system permease small subunit